MVSIAVVFMPRRQTKMRITRTPKSLKDLHSVPKPRLNTNISIWASDVVAVEGPKSNQTWYLGCQDETGSKYLLPHWNQIRVIWFRKTKRIHRQYFLFPRSGLIQDKCLTKINPKFSRDKALTWCRDRWTSWSNTNRTLVLENLHVRGRLFPEFDPVSKPLSALSEYVLLFNLDHQ